MTTNTVAILKELQRIPGVGKSLSQDLVNIGVRSIASLKGKNPETLYRNLCNYEGQKLDRCVLYVFRCAVYYASHARHEKEFLKWWNWTDEKMDPSLL